MPEATNEIEPPSPEPEEPRPPRRVIGGSYAGWLILAVAGLFFLILAAALWYALAPVTLARLVGRLAAAPLNIEGLALTVDRRPLLLPPGATLEVTPRQKIAVGALVANRWLNYDLSLTSPDLDLALVTGGQSAAPADFLDPVFQPAVTLRLEALDQDRPAAEFKILVQYETRDYAAWAAQTRDPLRRAEIYRKLLELDPKYPVAEENLAASLAEAGQSAEAAAIYEEMLARRPGLAEVQARLLDLYGVLDRRDRQSAALKRLLALNRAQGLPAALALRRFVDGCVQGGRLNQAEEVLKGLWPGAPPHEAVDILEELVLLRRRLGDVPGEIEALKSLAKLAAPERAREIWSGLLARYETLKDDSGRLEALRSLAVILPDGPEKANVHKTIGLMAARSSDYGAAAAAYRAALNLTPEDQLTRLNLARVRGLAGARQEYRAGLRELAAKFPDRLDYREELAEALREDGLWPQAQEQFQVLVEARPDDLPARLALMEMMEKNHDNDGLLAQYEILASLRPDDQVALYNYGALLFDRKQYDEAARVFQKLLALNAGEEAREYLLAIYQRQDKTPEMLEQAQALYRLDTSKAVYRDLVLNTFENAKDWRQFTEAAADFAALKPDDPEAWRQLARGQARLDQKKEAAQSLWRAAEADQGRAESWFSAGAAYAELGDLSRGREAYNKVLALDPGHKRAAQALTELDSPTAEGNAD